MSPASTAVCGVKINTRKTPHGAKIGDAFVFACVVGKIPKTPNLNPMADKAITRGGIQGLGSSLYICGCTL